MHKVEERLNIILRKAENSSAISIKDFSKLDVSDKLITFKIFSFSLWKIKFSALVLVLAYLLYKSDILNPSDEVRYVIAYFENFFLLLTAFIFCGHIKVGGCIKYVYKYKNGTKVNKTIQKINNLFLNI